MEKLLWKNYKLFGWNDYETHHLSISLEQVYYISKAKGQKKDLIKVLQNLYYTKTSASD